MTTQTPTLPDILDPPLEARDRLVVSGKTRMGKSELVKTILLPAWPRVVVIDAKKEYRKTHPDAPKGMRALEPLDLEGFVERLSDYDVAVSPDRELAVSVSAWGFSYEERSENFVSIVMLLEVCRSLHLVIDEIGMLPRTCWHAIDYLACLSASWDMPLTMISQRSTQIPKTARDQASRVVSFQQNNINDAAALEELMGPRARAIPSLPKYRYVYWHDSMSAGATETELEPEEPPSQPAPKVAESGKGRKKAKSKRTRKVRAK